MSLLHAYFVWPISLLRPGKGAKYCDQRVCLSVCLFVGPLTYFKSPIFCTCYLLPVARGVAVARLYYDGNAICYALPVLWMMSSFHIMEPMGQNQRQGVRFVQFTSWRHRGEICRVGLHLVSVDLCVIRQRNKWKLQWLFHNDVSLFLFCPVRVSRFNF